MNSVIELKGKRFVQESRKGGGGGPAMNSHVQITDGYLQQLERNLIQLRNFWRNEKRPFSGVLISVYYNKIVAKSNRIAGLFKGIDSNTAIVGAKFNEAKCKHIITYYLDIQDLDISIDLLEKSIKVMNLLFKKGISKEIFDNKSLFSEIS